MITVTSVQAQNNFGHLLDAVQREPITITRRGRPAAMIVAPQDFDNLMSGHKLERPDVMKAISSFRGAGKGGSTRRLLADRRVDSKKKK